MGTCGSTSAATDYYEAGIRTTTNNSTYVYHYGYNQITTAQAGQYISTYAQKMFSVANTATHKTVLTLWNQGGGSTSAGTGQTRCQFIRLGDA